MLGLRRDVLEINHQAAVLVAGKESRDFMAKLGVRIRIAQKTGNINPVFSVGVIHYRKDLGAGVLRLQKGHDLIVNRTHDSALNHLKKRFLFLGILTLQVAIRTEHVQPLRIEQINLARVLAE